MAEQTAELRWHPLLRQWVGVAANRQDRPQMPANRCPFCPGSGKVPDHYDVYLYPNDFSAFSFANPPFDPEPGPFVSTGAQGACDVVLYSPDHNLRPSGLTAEQWVKIIDLWSHRTRELYNHSGVRYVAVFENSGEAIGVTMPHPHGQIYAFPFVPPLVAKEVESATEFHSSGGECLYCALLAREVKEGVRVVAASAEFVAFLPFFGRFPTELSIYSRRHFGSLSDLLEGEKGSLAEMLATVRRKYDGLYGLQMPLMMMVRQAPAGAHPGFHFHIDFLPIQRSPTKLKYLAGVESGTGTFLNDTRPEEQAELMRSADPAS